MLINTNNSVQHYSFVRRVKLFQVLLYITKNLFKQSNDQTFLFQTIQVNMSNLFKHSLNIKQFYLTYRYDPIRCNHSGSEWTWEQWQWRSTQYSSKLQDWRLTIISFSAMSRILIEVAVLTPLQRCSQHILQPQPPGQATQRLSDEHFKSIVIFSFSSLKQNDILKFKKIISIILINLILSFIFLFYSCVYYVL